LKLDTVRSYYDNDAASKKVIDGEIAAMVVLAGAPQPMFAELKEENGVHFLPFDERSLPDTNVKLVLADYLPTELTHEQYPVLIPEGQTVPTFATRALLVAYAGPRTPCVMIRWPSLCTSSLKGLTNSMMALATQSGMRST
jgi:TRAP-type uncharacterized transport system substrate-binding protein